MKNYLFTSESVTEGHPDKICDRISDAILDEVLLQDKEGRVACEVLITTGNVIVAGEITTCANIDIENIVRNELKSIGYIDEECGINYKTCNIFVFLDKQSPDIAMGVDCSNEVKIKKSKDTNDIIGAGDQGMMFGFACNDTPEYMPLAVMLAHKLTKKLAEVRKNGEINYLLPDGKAQVTIEYCADKPIRIDNIVISAQHRKNVALKTLANDIIAKVVNPILPKNLYDENTNILINPTGQFATGGPKADTGVTGRKIIVDTYGGYAKHGGGAFSGKDPSKVDRSAAYAARYVAKNIVAAGLAEKCEIQVSYIIGIANPVSMNVNTFGTGKYSDDRLLEIIKSNFDLRPAVIIDCFGLNNPIYKKFSSYGHFGREDIEAPWEKTDKAEKLKSL